MLFLATERMLQFVYYHIYLKVNSWQGGHGRPCSKALCVYLVISSEQLEVGVIVVLLLLL